MTKQELEERVSELEAVVTALEDRGRHLEEKASDRDHWVRRFETEKNDHRATHRDLHIAKRTMTEQEEALNKARLTIAELMTQNVRLQGRLEGALIVTGHMRLKDAPK